ncbi:hypothetical protein D3C84_1092690 [compost metagenome]
MSRCELTHIKHKLTDYTYDSADYKSPKKDHFIVHLQIQWIRREQYKEWFLFAERIWETAKRLLLLQEFYQILLSSFDLANDRKQWPQNILDRLHQLKLADLPCK